MKWPRHVGIVDLGVAVVVLVAIVLPAREMSASVAMKGSDDDRFALALAEARVVVRPDDGAGIADLTRRLGEAGFKDWAIESSVDGSDRAKSSPTRWRALLAASVAFVDRIDVLPALDYANRALAACESAREAEAAATSSDNPMKNLVCPSFEEVRMQLYQQALDAGVKSGIDPRHDPAGFRRAGENAGRFIRLKSGTPERGSPPK